jgi:signal transduction histidine kinase
MRRPFRLSIVASAAGVGLFQVVGSFGAADNQPERQGIDALALLLVLLGPVVLAVRDRFPRMAVATSIAAATVYIACGYPYGPIFVSIVVALVWSVLAGHRRDTWLLSGIGYVAFLGASVIDPRGNDGIELLHWSLVAGWLVVVLVVSELVRIRRQQHLERARLEREARERRAGEHRLELAQELHDVLAHNISLINVQASVALHLLDEQPAQAGPALAAIKDASHSALQELRGALDLLRRGPEEVPPRRPAPRLADVEELLDGVRAGGIEVQLHRDDLPALPSGVELAAYRIVQEALTNVARHSRARAATVRIGYDGGVDLEVTDDGVGGPAVPGNGLTGMQERADALGGRFEAGAGPEGGFRVAAHLPVEGP